MKEGYIYNASGERIKPIIYPNTFTASECRTAFVEYMNAKAADIGMDASVFMNPTGLDESGHTVTASDMIQLLLCATGYDELVSVWSKDTYTVKIKGDNAREVEIDTTVAGASLENTYHIFGGKTGTTSVKNLVAVVDAPNGNQLLCVVLDTGNDRFLAAKQACDIAKAVIENPDYDYSGDTVDANNVAVALVPMGNPRMYDGYDLPLLFAKNATSQVVPASTTKILTAICALDFVKNIHESFEIIESDISSGSGYDVYAGDRITFKDALYSMMLPSANSIAKALARVVGRRILSV